MSRTNGRSDAAPGGPAPVDTQEPVAPGGHVLADTHVGNAPGGHLEGDTRDANAPGGPAPTDTQQPVAPRGHENRDTQISPAPGGQTTLDTQLASAPGGDRPVDLIYYADTLQDLEDARRAAEERLRSLTHDTVEGDRGGWYGKALAADDPVVEQATVIFQGLQRLERHATRNLEAAMAAHPLGDWVKAQRGLGLKSIARLLGIISDPVWNPKENRPRTLGELFSYCGVAGPDQRRRRGHKVTYNPAARTRLYVVAEALIKHGVRKDENGERFAISPWGQIYLDARRYYADAVHTEPCEKRVPCCATAKNPEFGAVGSPLRPGHIHGRAQRRLMREVLRALFLASGGQTGVDTHSWSVPGGQATNDAQAIRAPGDQCRRDTHTTNVLGGQNLRDVGPGGQVNVDTHASDAVGVTAQLTPGAKCTASPMEQAPPGTRRSPTPRRTPSPGAKRGTTPTRAASPGTTSGTTPTGSSSPGARMTATPQTSTPPGTIRGAAPRGSPSPGAPS